MPEGDAVWRTAARLHAGLAGAELTRCDLRWPSVATADLRGWTTVAVVPRGKHVLHRLVSASGSAWTLHSHLRMDGSWRVTPASRPVRPSHTLRALLATPANVATGWSLGMLDLVPTSDEHRLVGHLGPDLLGPDWDATLARTRLAADGRELGAALLDQRNLAGLGTMWVSEALHRVGLHPLARADAVGAGALDAVVDAAHTLIHTAVAGRPGRGYRAPAAALAVFGRPGRPCPGCGTAVAQVEVGPDVRERTLSFCPRCQPLPGVAARGGAAG